MWDAWDKPGEYFQSSEKNCRKNSGTQEFWEPKRIEESRNHKNNHLKAGVHTGRQMFIRKPQDIENQKWEENLVGSVKDTFCLSAPFCIGLVSRTSVIGCASWRKDA